MWKGGPITIYGITIPPATRDPDKPDPWVENTSIRHLATYTQIKKARLVWDGTKHDWEEDR